MTLTLTSDLLSRSNTILNRNLSRIMNPYGRYTVSYTPSDDPCEYLQVSTQMSISGEASLPDMLNFLTDFLRASGYVFDGELEIVDAE
jgi:hypothetical protein